MAGNIPTRTDLENMKQDIDDLADIVNSVEAQNVVTRLGKTHRSLTGRLDDLQTQLDAKDAEGQAALVTAKDKLVRYAAVNYKGDFVASTAYEANDVWKNPADNTLWIVPSDYTSGATAQADIDAKSVRPHQDRDRVVSVDTVADMRLIGDRYPGMTVSVSGHSQVGIGGGEFVWLPGDYTAEVTADDVGVVIAADDDPTGSIGAYVLNHRGSMTLDQWGCVGNYDNDADTGADDSVSFLKAIKSGIKLAGRKGANYLITSSETVTDTDIDLDLNGSTIWQRGDFTPIHAHAQFSDIQYVSAIATGSVTLTGDGVGSSTSTHVLTVADATGYKKNDIVKIYSDDLIQATNPDYEEQRGEFAKVSKVSGNDIYLYSYLRDEYTTNIRIAKMNSRLSFRVYNGKMNSAAANDPADNQPLITCNGYFEPFTAVTSDYCCSELVEFISCLSARSYGMSAKEQRTSILNYAYGYTIVEYSCEGGVHLEPKGYDCRHVYTTGTLSTDPDDARPERYGRTRDFRVVGGYGSNCQNSAFDTHPESLGGVFDTCVAIAPYNGPNGTQRNYQLRGQGAKVVNCKSEGGTGYHIYGSYEHPDSARGNEIINSSHDGLPVYQSGRYAISVEGRPGYPVLDTKVKQFRSDLKTGGAPFIWAEHARVEVIDVDSKGIYTSDYTWVVHAGDDAQIVFKKGKIDYRGSTGADIRAAGVRSHTGDIRFYGTEILSDDAEIELARMNPSTGVDGNGTLIAKGLITNNPIREYSSTLGVTYAGASSMVAISYECDSASSALINAVFTGGGNKEIKLQNRADKNLLCILTTPSGTPNITELDPGNVIGQRLTFSVDASSGGAFNILNTCTNVSLSADVSIPVSGSFSLMWSGSVWVAA